MTPRTTSVLASTRRPRDALGADCGVSVVTGVSLSLVEPISGKRCAPYNASAVSSWRRSREPGPQLSYSRLVVRSQRIAKNPQSGGV